MYCVNCGKQIPDRARFCPHCGAAQDSNEAPAAAAAVPQQQPQAQARQMPAAPVQQAQYQQAPVQQAPAQQPPAPVQQSYGLPTVSTMPQAAPGGQPVVISLTSGKRSEYLIPVADVSQAVRTAEGVLGRDGYHLKDYRDEPQVYKKGTGAATAMKYVKVMTYQNCLWLQAWVQIGLLDAGFNEMSLEGVLGAIPKKSCQKTVNKIKAAV